MVHSAFIFQEALRKMCADIGHATIGMFIFSFFSLGLLQILFPLHLSNKN